MEKSELHTQKIAILGRLIKESSLTLEEALVLLKEEEVEKVEEPTMAPTPTWMPGMGTGTYPQPSQPLWPYGSSGSGTIRLNGGIGYPNTVTTNGVNPISNTTVLLNTTSTTTADLNT